MLPSYAAGLTYASKVESYTEGAGIKEAYRRNTSNALGNPNLDGKFFDNNKKFLSLGVGGQAIFSFGTAFQDSVTIWETTWGAKKNQNSYDEQVEVYVSDSLSGNWILAGLIKNIADNAYRSQAGATVTLQQGATYNFLKLVDKSAAGSDRDGFDINGIAVKASATQPVPEPTTMSGLAVAAAGLVAARRRQAKQKAETNA
ncbi:PEP-CTERM sorting domain-containing protein [Leptolyngbya sp. AN02str]|uniref:PEP-CTERM sorting domain-containing protein n=1 Tax=Leptolyngbya sp. AN02str TaxID=3423363 RepID=UPI003D319B00